MSNIELNKYKNIQKKSFIVVDIENVNGRNLLVLKCLDCGKLKKVRKTRFLNEEFSECSCKSKPLSIGTEKYGFKIIQHTNQYERFAYRIACIDCGKEYVVQKSVIENGKKLPKCPCKGRDKRLRKSHKCDSIIGTVLKDRNFKVIEKIRLESDIIGVRLKCLNCGKTYDVDYRLILTNRYGFCSCDERYMKNKSEGAVKKYSKLLGKQVGELYVKELKKDKYYFYICDCSCGEKDVSIYAHTLFKGLCYACPKCHLSFGETVIKNFLNEYNIFYKSQVSFDELRGEKTGKKYRFDFGVYSNNFDKLLCLIEFDGPQHNDISFYMLKDNLSLEEANKKLEACKLRDNEKTNFCKIKNIPLLRIKYKRSKKYIYEVLLKFLKEEGVFNYV